MATAAAARRGSRRASCWTLVTCGHDPRMLGSRQTSAPRSPSLRRWRSDCEGAALLVVGGRGQLRHGGARSCRRLAERGLLPAVDDAQARAQPAGAPAVRLGRDGVWPWRRGARRAGAGGVRRPVLSRRPAGGRGRERLRVPRAVLRCPLPNDRLRQAPQEAPCSRRLLRVASGHHITLAAWRRGRLRHHAQAARAAAPGLGGQANDPSEGGSGRSRRAVARRGAASSKQTPRTPGGAGLPAAARAMPC